MSIFNRFKGDTLLIIWIRNNINKEELKGKNEEEINEYIYNKLKTYTSSHHPSLSIHLCKSWLKTGRLYEIVLLLGYFGGKNYLKEAKLYDDYGVPPLSSGYELRLASSKILTENEELNLINTLKK